MSTHSVSALKYTDQNGNVFNLIPDASGKAPLASPAFTGTPTAPTASDGTNNTQIATTAFVMNAFSANDAMLFKGTVGSSGATVTALPANHKKGWTYKVATAGTYAGVTCEIGDTIYCVTNGSTANDAHWAVVQANIDGAVTGPASSTANHVATFNGTNGKVIKDSGFTIEKSVPSNAVFTDTDTKVTSAANHYSPSRDTSADKASSASGATAAWNIDVVTGVTLETDGKGHVTGVKVTSGKIPGNPNTNTTYTLTQDASDGHKITLTPSTGSATTITIPDNNTTYTFDGTYNASTNKAATVSTVTNAIGALDGNLNSTTPGAGKTLTAFSETDGIVSATFGNISITKSQVSDFPTRMTPASHTHGNIQNGGTLQTNDVAIASGDKLVVTDSSNSNKVARTNISFDGSTTTQALTKKGTWGTFLTSHQDISGKAPLASPAFTGTPTAPTAADGTNNTQIATTAFVMSAFKANDVMVFKGTIGSSGATVTALPDTHYQGWTYRVLTAGTYAGKACEIGDMIICVTDGTSANNDHWTVVQTNIDGAVTGPSSSTDAHVAVFNGASGKVIKDSGFTIGKSVPSNAVFTDTTYTFDGTYNASTNKAATVSTVTSAINALDGNLNSTTPGAGKTLTAFSQTDGKVSATFGNISITKSQVSDFPTSMTPASHTHGSIQNGGTLQTNDITIANGDKLVVTDSSNSSKIARASISFDGSTATQALTKKGTWETFAPSSTVSCTAANVKSALGTGSGTTKYLREDGTWQDPDPTFTYDSTKKKLTLAY